MTKEELNNLLNLFRSDQEDNIKIGIGILAGQNKSDLEIFVFLLMNNFFKEEDYPLIALFIMQLICPETRISTEMTISNSTAFIDIKASLTSFKMPFYLENESMIDCIKQCKR